MLNVSEAFTTAINADGRSLHGAVIAHFLGEQTFPFATATATSQYDSTTPPDQACNGRIRTTDYDCEGALPNALADPQKGWWSGDLADGNGDIATQTLTVTYTTPLTGGNFQVIGIPGYYPVDFVVERYVADAWENVATVTDNTEYEWSTVVTSALTEAVRLIITKIAPVSSMARVIQFGLVSTIVFEGADLKSISLLEEVNIESTNPLGSVSSNECTISLSNDNGRFNARNSASPFFNLMSSNIMLCPYVGVQLASGHFEYVTLGTFFSGDWTNPADEACVVAYDRLYNLLTKPVPEISLQLNCTITDLFTAVFAAMGITEYDIDPALTLPVKWAWVPQGNFGEIMRQFSIAGGCCIFMSRTDRIQVKSILQTGASVATFTESTHISAFDNPQLNRSTFSSVIVNCAVPNVQNPELIAQLTDVTFPIGTTILNDIVFNSGPIASVSHVMLVDTLSVSVVDFSWSPWSMTLEVLADAEEIISVEVYGHRIANTTTAVTKNTDVAEGPTLTIDCNLIQHPDVATDYADDVYDIVKNPLATLMTTVRHNPAIELLDIVTISNTVDKIPDVDAIVLSCALNFDGGLSANLRKRAIS